MATLNPPKRRPTPEIMLALSDFVVGLHECQLSSRLAFVGEAAGDITIQRGQILIVTLNDSEADEDAGFRPELVLAAAPPEVRIGGFRQVDAEASA